MNEEQSQPLPAWAERLVSVLDDGFEVPGLGIRFGLDAVIGALLPGVGDLLTGSSSLAVVMLALRRGVPKVVLLRMLLNLLLDGLVGIVPVLGDAFDVVFKSNRRNLRLLQRSAGTTRPSRMSDYVIVGIAGLILATLACLPWVLFYFGVTAFGD